MAQHNHQSIISKIGLANIQARDLFQRAVRLAHPIPHGHFAMVALRDDVRQPNSGRPAPTESLLQSMPRKMPIQELRQTHLLHQGQEHHKIIDALCLNVHIFFHTSQYARKFTFCLPPYANGE
jgi:hypothetical protein